MPYTIQPYTKRKAQKLNVLVKPSVVKGKKIDVFTKNGIKICSIGAIGYADFPTLMAKANGNTLKIKQAKQRRKLYKLRHQKDRKVKNSPGFYADQLLW